MEIGVKVDAENSYTGERRHIVSAYMTFVALDQEGQPAHVPALVAETPEQKRRYAEAQFRRDERLKTREGLRRLRDRSAPVGAYDRFRVSPSAPGP